MTTNLPVALSILNLANEANDAVASLQAVVRRSITANAASDRLSVEAVETMIPLMPPNVAEIVRGVVNERKQAQANKGL